MSTDYTLVIGFKVGLIAGLGREEMIIKYKEHGVVKARNIRAGIVGFSDVVGLVTIAVHIHRHLFGSPLEAVGMILVIEGLGVAENEGLIGTA